MDGTMIDSMPYHIKTWQKTLESLGVIWNEKEHIAQLYGKNEEVLSRILKNELNQDFLKEIIEFKEQYYQNLYRPQLKLLPGLEEFLCKLHGLRGTVLGIGTSACRSNVDMMLEVLKMERKITAIVAAEDVEFGKPHPETFIRLAEILKVQPERCIVFEDVPKGIEAGKSAGMNVVAITTGHTKEELKDADLIIENYIGIEEKLRSCFSIEIG